MAIEEDLRSVRSRIDTVRTKQARAAVEREAAEARKDDALVTLKSFKVETPEQGEALVGRLEKELAKTVEEIDAALTEAGA